MIAVIYQPLPNDPSSGTVLWTTEATEQALQASSLPWVEVTEMRCFGATHKVLSGKLVPITQ